MVFHLSPRPRRTTVAVASLGLLCVVATTSCGGLTSSTTTATDAAAPAGSERAVRTFVEKFDFSGAPAFETEQGGYAVWWNQDNWDVRTDTHYSSQDRFSESDPYKGAFIAIEKAKNPTNLTTSGVLPGAGPKTGDGSPGVGVMRVDFQGVSTARLRNPMLISDQTPGVVSFWAPLFATTGHWWEIAITPTTKVVGGEYTAIPGRQTPESLNNPIDNAAGDGSTNGPGHRANVQDSINVISTGYPDAPACNGSDWRVRWAATKATDGKVQDFVNPKGSMEKLTKVNPAKRTQLRKWQLVYKPSGIELYSAINDKNKLKLVDSWKVSVPWKEVYVNLLYAGYQAGHHPQEGCGLHTHGITQGQEMGWRDVLVSPVKYRATYTLPRPTPTVNVPRRDGWMSYDLRDLNYHRGGGQPNSGFYDQYESYAYCSEDTGGGLPCPGGPTDVVTLRTSIAASELQGLARSQLLADVRYGGSAVIEINGKRVGTLQGQPKRPDVTYSGGTDEFEELAWVRRSVDLPLDALVAGDNVIRLILDPKTNIDLDRIQLELSVM